MQIKSAYIDEIESGVYVVAVDGIDGNVYRHEMRFERKIEARKIDGIPTLVDAEKERAERLAERVEAAGQINKTRWSFVTHI